MQSKSQHDLGALAGRIMKANKPGCDGGVMMDVVYSLATPVLDLFANQPFKMCVFAQLTITGTKNKQKKSWLRRQNKPCISACLHDT